MGRVLTVRSFDRVVTGFAIGFGAVCFWEARRRGREAERAEQAANDLQKRLRAGLTALGEAIAANERLLALVAQARKPVLKPPPVRVADSGGAGPNGIYMWAAARAKWIGPFGLN